MFSVRQTITSNAMSGQLRNSGRPTQAPQDEAQIHQSKSGVFLKANNVCGQIELQPRHSMRSSNYLCEMKQNDVSVCNTYT
jgi:hypothetical protein